MLENIMTAFGDILTVRIMFLMFSGLTIGIIAGALPGFSSSNACAVMLPVTLLMGPEGALVFFASVYNGAQYGGSIPAILVNTPGTPGAGATALDGYPMAKAGHPDMALGISLMASCMGAIISSVIVLLAIKPIASVAFKFGPPEMFVIAILGLSIIASVIGADIKKGLLSGMLGLLIAAMVADPSRGVPRLTFGFLELYDTVPFVPAVIGLFAVTELFYLAGKERIADSPETGKIGNFGEIIKGMKLVLRNPAVSIKSALIGLFIGAIPGAGTTIATFVSYGEAKKSSMNPEKFGSGVPEGIIASEAANNGVTSGALIPMLVLGVPGSGTTAIMLAALMLHGVRPGPELMMHFAPMAYMVIITLACTGILMLLMGLLLGKYFAKIVLVPTNVLLPVILALCIIGAFAYRNAFFDTYLLLTFGVLGFFMRIGGYPFIPMILGIILGPMAESNLYRSLQMSGGDLGILFFRPITLFLWAIVFLSIFRPYIKKGLRKIFTQSS
jgi:putative tricarboxylic transport membrane protein